MSGALARLRPRWGRGVDQAREVRAAAPGVMTFSVELAEALTAEEDAEEAQGTLELALARAVRTDHEYTEKARLLLARLYAKAGLTEAAAAQYRALADATERTEWAQEARRYGGGVR